MPAYIQTRRDRRRFKPSRRKRFYRGVRKGYKMGRKYSPYVMAAIRAYQQYKRRY